MSPTKRVKGVRKLSNLSGMIIAKMVADPFVSLGEANMTI
jgi:hypothetical protein